MRLTTIEALLMKTFDYMLTEAKTKNYERDKNRSEKRDKAKRYEVLGFPAYHGSPLMTNSFILAWVMMFARSFRYIEARIIDRKTGKHYVM